MPANESALNRLLYLEIKSFLVDHNLNYTDKMSMAAGVEVRVPYLDLELVNFSTTIPVDLKMKGVETKYLLRKVAKRFLPAEVINRPKAGFGAPVRKWIVNDMDEMIYERLSPGSIDKRGIFSSKKIQELIVNNKKGVIDASYTIWSLLAIESWMKQFAD
jgi:asparagine synthase (glutamine-hydrolysing)